MNKNNEIQIGKAGEYLACADMITKGLVAYPSEQGLPYDVVVDNGKRLLKCQVKTTEKPRVIPQRNKKTHAYIFNIKRHGRNGKKRYTPKDVDLFALVELETRTVGYLLGNEMPATINLRVDRLRGTYYDEKGVLDSQEVIELRKGGSSQKEISKLTGLHISAVSRMLKHDYDPFISNAKYFSDLYRDVGWFYGI